RRILQSSAELFGRKLGQDSSRARPADVQFTMNMLGQEKHESESGGKKSRNSRAALADPAACAGSEARSCRACRRGAAAWGRGLSGRTRTKTGFFPRFRPVARGIVQFHTLRGTCADRI